MSGFFWNVRGLNKSTKHSVIKKWVEDDQFKFGCLIETRVKKGKAGRVGYTIFKYWSILTNYEYSPRGRIWVVWRNDVRLTPFYKNSQVITCSVKSEDQEDEFFCSFVYASNFLEKRKVLWKKLMDHHNSHIIGMKPWILVGDFNEILDMEDHSGRTYQLSASE